MSDFMPRLVQFLAGDRGSEVGTEAFYISHSLQEFAIELPRPLQSAAEHIMGYHIVSGDGTDHGHQQGPQLQHGPQTGSWSWRQHAGIYVSGLEKIIILVADNYSCLC